MTLLEWIESARSRLSAAGVESPGFEAQLIAAHTLGQSRSWVLAHSEDPIEAQPAEEILERRLTREPLAYILGRKEFYGRSFAVRPGVLIPRPETECLIELVLDIVRDWPSLRTLLDVGTGSGCIGITLALESNLEVMATDISEEALGVARENAATLSSGVEFLLGDGFAPVQGRLFDIIVSNPPYIADDEVLMPEVARFEPPEALFAGAAGLDAYRWLMQGAAAYIAEGGWLCVEIGAGQRERVEAVADTFGWELMRTMRDLLSHERVLGFRRRV